MTNVVPLPSYTWPTVEFPLAALGVRIDALARRLDLPLYDWEEEGLGPARGVVVRLPSGRAALLRELAHAVEHLDAGGPDVWVDAAEVAEVGIERLVNEVREALALAAAEVVWVQPSTHTAAAAELAARAREHQESRERKDLGQGRQADRDRDHAV